MGSLRLHPSLLVHTVPLQGQRRLVAQASAARPPLILRDPLALTALSALPSEFDRKDAGAAWSNADIPASCHEELWKGFEAAGLFAPADGSDVWWEEFGWREARTYHEATRDYPFLQMDQRNAFREDGERMERYRDEAPAPSPYQHLGADGSLPLPGLRENELPDDRLRQLGPAQRFGREGLGLLLDVCFGQRGRMKAAGEVDCVLKSIPSGGARHPTEIFLAAFEAEGIPAGVYHYDVENHQLERLAEGQYREAFAEATADLFGRYDTPPAAALVFTSRVERAMWRYRDPRSFRAILVDVGHAVMAYRRVARMLGFRTFAYQKFRDTQVAELLGIDRAAQPPLYVGTLVP